MNTYSCRVLEVQSRHNGQTKVEGTEVESQYQPVVSVPRERHVQQIHHDAHEDAQRGTHQHGQDEHAECVQRVLEDLPQLHARVVGQQLNGQTADHNGGNGHHHVEDHALSFGVEDQEPAHHIVVHRVSLCVFLQ